MIDIIVISVFLIVTLIIGTYAGRSITSIKEFAVGRRNYSSFTVFATLSASFIGGGYTFGLSEKVFTSGISNIICLLGFSLQQILIALILAPRMQPFYDSLSVGDIMAKLYGPTGRLTTGVCSILVSAGIVGAQVNATGYVFNLFLGIDHNLGVLIGCGIVIAYSVFGGMKAVVATDILQFGCLIIAIPLTLIIGILYVGGFASFVASIPPAHLQIPGSMPMGAMASLFLSLLLGEALVPAYVQRLFIAKDINHTKRGILWSGLTSIPFFALAGGLGLLALTLEPTLNSNIAMPHVLQTVLPIGLKGFAIAGIIAVVMSSADSHLNAAAIAAVHDVIKPLNKTPITNRNELRLTRLATLAIGVMSIVFAISIESVLDVLLYSYNFWAPTILIPLVAGIIGFRISPQGFIGCALIGAFSVLIWNTFYAASGIDGLVIGVLMNALTFTLIYLAQKKALSVNT